ncbi:ATP-binding protein [Solirubrobacter taibaiensis]|nr:ATP-binding protein [Solirubrobacter taibaiensis]
MLAEQSNVLGWGIPAGVAIESVAAETAEAVDDQRLGLSDGSRVLLQAKRQLTAATSEGSPLDKTAVEFVRQHLADGGQASPLVLVCGPASSGPIKEALPRMLERLRGEPPADANDLESTNEQQRSSYDALVEVLERAWLAQTGAPAPAAEFVALLSRIHVTVLAVEEGGGDEANALNNLAGFVLADPAAAQTTWGTLVTEMLGLARGQRGMTRGRLQTVLSARGVGLAVVRSYRDDVAALRARTATALGRLERHRALRLANERVQLPRPAAAALRAVAEQRSVLLVGPPGIGKSGLMADLVANWLDDGVNVVGVRVEDLSAATEDELRRELGLTHPLADVLANWPGPPAILVIDGLDAARGADATHTLVTLINQIVSDATRWRVLASVRTFDLRHDAALRAAFSGLPAPDFTHPEFGALSHFSLQDLGDDELGALKTLAPQFAGLIEQANPDLRSLLRNPFNLSLLADLATRVEDDRLTRVRTQLELLSLHWGTVVVAPVHERDRRERALHAVCTAAAASLSLQASRDAVLGTTERDEAAVLGLLRAGVIVEHAPLSGFGQAKVGFSHNVLFDYAFARLILAEDSEGLAAQLASEPDLPLLARPSLVMRLEDLWARDDEREEFWTLALLLADDTQGVIARLAAPAVVAQQLDTFDQLAGLLARLVDPVEQRRAAADRLTYEVVAARIAAGPDTRPLSTVTPNALEAWAKLAAHLAHRDPGGAAANWLALALWQEAGAS